MCSSKLSRLLVPAFLFLLPASFSHAVINQTDPNYVAFEAGDYTTLTNPPPMTLPDIASEIIDNGDGTLTTTVEGEGLGQFESLVAYDINFTSTGDYYLYFLEEGGGALFVNHGTGFGTIPGKEEDDNAVPGISEDWNSLDNGWNGLFEIGDGLGGNSNYTVDPQDGRPEWSWPVTAAGTTSFTVRSNEDGIDWQNFVFSKSNDLSAGDLYALAGVSPPDAPRRVEFWYDSAPGGTRAVTATLDTSHIGGPGVLTFGAAMPDPNTHVDPNPSLTPAGSIGSITTAYNDGSHTMTELPGLSWTGQSVTLKAYDSDGGYIYEITVPLVYGPDDETFYTLPDGEVGMAFPYDWVQTFSDNADPNAATVTDAITPTEIMPPWGDDLEVQMATWQGLSQRESDGSFTLLAGPDGPLLSEDGDLSGNAEGEDLALFFGWRRRGDLTGGSIQWDSTNFHGFVPVTARDFAGMIRYEIPEPGAVAIAACGMLGLLVRRRARTA